jgi:mannosyltransferase OCH1-like enzyme
MHKAAFTWVNNKPEYYYRFFDDVDVDLFVKYWHLSIRQAFCMIIPKAGKIDLWRLLMVYNFGGIYQDFDSASINPFRQWINAADDIISGVGMLDDWHH